MNHAAMFSFSSWKILPLVLQANSCDFAFDLNFEVKQPVASFKDLNRQRELWHNCGSAEFKNLLPLLAHFEKNV